MYSFLPCFLLNAIVVYLQEELLLDCMATLFQKQSVCSGLSLLSFGLLAISAVSYLWFWALCDPLLLIFLSNVYSYPLYSLQRISGLCAKVIHSPSSLNFRAWFCWLFEVQILLFLNQGRWVRLAMEKPSIIRDLYFIVLYLDSWFKVEILFMVTGREIYLSMAAPFLMKISR